MFRSHMIHPLVWIWHISSTLQVTRAFLPIHSFLSVISPKSVSQPLHQHKYVVKLLVFLIFFSTFFFSQYATNFFPFDPGDIWWSFQIFSSPRGHAEAVPWLRGRRRGRAAAHGPGGLGEDAAERLCGVVLSDRWWRWLRGKESRGGEKVVDFSGFFESLMMFHGIWWVFFRHFVRFQELLRDLIRLLWDFYWDFLWDEFMGVCGI